MSKLVMSLRCAIPNYYVYFISHNLILVCLSYFFIFFCNLIRLIFVLLVCYMQKIDGDHVRLVDYLDWVVGTSTGGLMASMLTTPNKNNRPLYAAKDIIPFYRQHCPKIFPQPRYI